MCDLFGKVPRRAPRIIAHAVDVGVDFAEFKCKKCKWESGWVYVGDESNSKIRKGIPCGNCNNGDINEKSELQSRNKSETSLTVS